MDFCEEVEELLQRKDYDKLDEIIFNPKNQENIQTLGMDLITRICECGLAFCLELDSLRMCQDILMHVAKTVRPKEALISLLEQAEIFVHSDSDKFSSLLAPLQYVMLSLPKKREHSFSWVLSILNSHVKSQHKLPEKLKTKFIRGKDAFLMEEQKEIKDAITTYKEYCNFYEPFVQQFFADRTAILTLNNDTELTEAISSIQRQQGILRDHLVQLLGDPFLYLDLHWEEHADTTVASSSDCKNLKTDARLISERLMGFLRIVDQNPDYYYDWSSRKIFMERTKLRNKPIYCGDDDESDDTDSDEFVVDFSSVVNYYYLIHVEGINEDILPSIHSPTHVFISNVRLMYGIISDEKAGPMCILKCFQLSRKLIQKLDDAGTPGLTLESELLETSTVTDFIESVAYHTVYCETLEVRREGLQVLKEMLWKFDPKGRYDFIMFAFNRVKHDGIQGYMITQLKDLIRVALDSKRKDMLEYFTGKFLVKQLRMTCYLKNGITTDLMENKEQIMCALNLLLYLAIRDKTANATGIYEILPELEKKLLEPLYKGLEFSRAHYQLKLKELSDTKTAKAQLEKHRKLVEEVDVSFMNANGLSPEISLDEQKQTLYTALGVFDIMNGTLARVNEVCDIFRKMQQSN